MRERAQGRLPKISYEVSKIIKGSFDFLGINHYTTNYAKNISDDPLIIGILNNDTLVDAGVIPIGKAIYDWFLILIVLYLVNELSNSVFFCSFLGARNGVPIGERVCSTPL